MWRMDVLLPWSEKKKTIVFSSSPSASKPGRERACAPVARIILPACNSIGVSDGRGKCLGDTAWVRHAAEGATHETAHILYASNTAALGERATPGADFNELFASLAPALSKPPSGGPGDSDIPFGQSLLPLLIDPPGGSCPAAFRDDVDLCVGYSVTDEEDCRTGYVNWAL